MKNKPTLTIGIPAYNEEANIGYLLNDLLKQKQSSFILEGIIISSDGSDDKTVIMVQNIGSDKIKVLDNSERKGQAFRQNQIIGLTNSDILVLLNADILIKDPNFIEKLVAPIIRERADLTSSCLSSLQGNSLFEKILSVSRGIKEYVYERHQNGNNLYTCYGAARAFSRKLYKQVNFQHSVGEDAYSYLKCISLRCKFVYVKSAQAFIKSPDNFLDHQKQSIRFLQSQKVLIEYFGKNFVRVNYFLPLSLLYKSLGYHLIHYPLHTILYLIIFSTIKFKALFSSITSETWSISISSKTLRRLS